MPHLVRLVFGGDNARVLPASAFCGAVFLIWADASARVLMAPEDIPIGIVTGLCGGLFFIWTMAAAATPHRRQAAHRPFQSFAA